MIRAEINEREQKNNRENHWKQKLLLWKKFNKIGKPLPRLIENKREKTHY